MTHRKITNFIIGPHCRTTYVLAVYIVIDRVGRPSLSVCRSRSVTLVSPAKATEPIDIPFGLRTQVGPRNDVYDGDPDPNGKRQFFLGGGKGGSFP